MYSAPTGPPVNITAVPISPTSITISWDLPLPHERNGIITGYSVTISSEETTTILTTGETMLSFNDLRPFSSYMFNILASTRVGPGPVSGTIIGTTLEDGMTLT